MIKLPAILTRFSISTDNIDPQLCTEYIGLQPTKVLKKGEPRPYPRPAVPESSWNIETSRQNLYSLDESMIDLLKLVWPRKDQIISFCSEHNVGCSFITLVWADEEHRPIYELSRESLSKVAALQASWILDLV